MAFAVIVKYKRVGKFRDLPRLYHVSRLEGLDEAIREDVKNNLIKGKNVTVSIIDIKERPIVGQLDYGLSGEFTASVD